MKHFVLIAVSAGLALPAAAQVMPGDASPEKLGGDGSAVSSQIKPPTKAEDLYMLAVCHPKVASGPEPPCAVIGDSASRCSVENGDDIVASAKCLCEVTEVDFFQNWHGCQSCLQYHGFRSERDTRYWANVVNVASSRLCVATPTAAFDKIFASVAADTLLVPPVTDGSTELTDRGPHMTDVSLYYTPSPKGTDATPTTKSTPTSEKTTKSTPTSEKTPKATAEPSKTTAADGKSTRASVATSSMPKSSMTHASMHTSSMRNSSANAAPTGGVAPRLALALAGAALVAAV